MTECLFDGPIPKDAPGDQCKIFSCHCGEKVYIIGRQPIDYTIIQNLRFERKFSLLEISNGKATTYPIDAELYFSNAICYLDKDLFVTFSTPGRYQVYQSLWKLNRITKRLENKFNRIISFSGTKGFGVSTSRLPSGYALIYGEKFPSDEDENDSVPYVMRFVAANPLQIKEFPDIILDKEVAKLQKKCLQRDLEITFRPFVSADSIYFLLKILDEPEKHRIGSISKEKGKTKIKIVDTDGDHQILLMGYLRKLTHSDNNGILWLPYILYKPSGWRLTLGYWIHWMCVLAHHYIGRPLVSFAEYDNGYLFLRFIHLYWYIVENTCVTIDGSSPTLALRLSNFKNKRCHGFRIDGQIEFPLFTGDVLTTASPNGDLLAAELCHHTPLRNYYDRLRITRFKNPYRVSKLLEITYEMCKEMYPSTTDKLRNILNVNNRC